MKLLISEELKDEAGQFLTPPYSIYDPALPIFVDYCFERYGESCCYLINNVHYYHAYALNSSCSVVLKTQAEQYTRHLEQIQLDYIFLDKLIAYTLANRNWSFSACLKAILEKKKDDYNEIGSLTF